MPLSVPTRAARGLFRAAGQRTSPASAGGGRLAAVDGLRLLAAAAVAAYHYLGTPTPRFWGEAHDLPREAPLLHAISGYGWLGVEAFFLISGFVVCMSCWGRTPAQFAVSRIARLFPLYWAVVLIIVAAGTVTVLAGQRSGAPTDLRTTLGNLTMIPSPLGLDLTAGVAWTLWVEARFYLLMGALLLIGLTYRRAIAFGFLWLVLASFGRELHSTVLDELLLGRYAGLFVAGIALYLMHRFGPNLLLWLLAGFAWCYTLTVLDDRVSTHPGTSWTVSAAALTGFLALLALAGPGPLRHLRWRPLIYAGALTYPFYLVHQSLGIPLTRGILSTVPGLGLLPSIGLGLVLSLLLAAALNRLVDRPLGRLLRRHLTTALNPRHTHPNRPARPIAPRPSPEEG
ncbi:acyltransferase [Streptomyces mobaraensis NBRC 13819 = DSM 40847]|uniref:Putative acyltransferase n=1 Tax=Streptomyces mobaraensis (strain ATCC 29032 / DSM 40847 / JCM 4168 / NBRC 13819 / NCIMB 11159 / IPCR 16-22) TaxID=1223523 RepID=M3A971_STRM1|nr:acyltransferase [Streptomyces mobaraensis]EMF01719.1 putative acyltransferase [Streptomyces mobaraensis NBRC 13819 = DSM 40847]QTT77042.1 acyltransferase [Streptomyces mobaraensis NBRC 13819 = DSM 40847]